MAYAVASCLKIGTRILADPLPRPDVTQKAAKQKEASRQRVQISARFEATTSGALLGWRLGESGLKP